MAVDQSERLREETDHFVLPLVGGVVDQLSIDFAFTLVVDGTHTVRMSRPLRYHDGSVEHVVDPADIESVVPLLGLHQAVVREARADKDGTLLLRFDGARTIVVTPDEEYEAWEVSGGMPPVTPDFQIICPPGGGVESF
jgi:hypothetical protein